MYSVFFVYICGPPRFRFFFFFKRQLKLRNIFALRANGKITEIGRSAFDPDCPTQCRRMQNYYSDSHDFFTSSVGITPENQTLAGCRNRGFL